MSARIPLMQPRFHFRRLSLPIAAVLMICGSPLPLMGARVTGVTATTTSGDLALDTAAVRKIDLKIKNDSLVCATARIHCDAPSIPTSVLRQPVPDALILRSQMQPARYGSRF